MAEVIKIVDPGEGLGHDYHSLSLWEAGEKKDLVTATEQATAKCRATGGTGDTTQVVISSSWITSTTYYIKIWTDPAESHRHDGKWNTGKYRLGPIAYYSSLSVESTGKNINIIGLQVEQYAGSNSRAAINYAPSSAGTLYLEQCVVRAVSLTATGCYGIYVHTGAFRVSNCVVYGFDTASSIGVRVEIPNPAANSWIYNCTVYDCTVGFELSSYRNSYIKNCLAIGCTDGFLEGTSADWYMSNCASDIASDAEDTDPHNGVSVSFAGAGDYHLGAGDTDVIGHGVDLSGDASYAITVDIDNVTRPTGAGTWDIGADQTVEATTRRRAHVQTVG